MIFDNGDVNVDYFYMNIVTVSVINNHKYVDYTQKIYEIYINRYLRGNNELPDCVDIYDMSPVSVHNQYSDMEYNN